MAPGCHFENGIVEDQQTFSIHTSNLLLTFGLDIQSQTKVRAQETKKSNMAARRPFWKRHIWKPIGFGPWPHTTFIWILNVKFQSKLELRFKYHATYRYRRMKYGRLVAILKVASLKINWLLPIHTSDVPVKCGLDIQIQTKIRFRKPQNSIWLPGGHFESDIAENK